MPIRPEQRALYPDDWPAISCAIRERSGGRCEWCGAENGRPHPTTGSYVVLTVAHLDHDPRNCAAGNLRALCQRCHLRYDHAQHVAHARETRGRRLGLQRMALEAVPAVSMAGAVRVPADGCPECVHGRAAPTAYFDRGDARICVYHCPMCGHNWTTTWSIAALRVPRASGAANGGERNG